MGETGVTESEAAEDATRAARPIPPTPSVPVSIEHKMPTFLNIVKR